MKVKLEDKNSKQWIKDVFDERNMSEAYVIKHMTYLLNKLVDASPLDIKRVNIKVVINDHYNSYYSNKLIEYINKI